jgi:MFS family permease
MPAVVANKDTTHHRRLGPLHEPQFRLFFSGQLLSLVGDGLLLVATSFAVLGAGLSATAVGLVYAARTVPLVGFVLVGGVWADRLPRQRLMLASDLIRGVALAVLGLLVVSGSAQLWQFLVLTAAYGAAEAFFRPAATGLIPQVVSPRNLQQANALIGISTNAGFVAGPALAGVLIAIDGPGLAILADAATFAVSAACLAALRPRAGERPARHERAGFLRELHEGYREVRARRWLSAVLLESSVILLVVVAPFQVLGPVVSASDLGGAGAWATISTGFGVGMVLGGAAALRFRPQRPMRTVYLLFPLLAPWASAALALTLPVAVTTSAAFTRGIAVGLFLTLWETSLQQHVPAHALSRVSSYDWMVSLSLMPLGFALTGPVAQLVGNSAVLWAGSIVSVVSALLVLSVPEVRSMQRVDVTAVARQPPAPDTRRSEPECL